MIPDELIVVPMRFLLPPPSGCTSRPVVRDPPDMACHNASPAVCGSASVIALTPHTVRGILVLLPRRHQAPLAPEQLNIAPNSPPCLMGAIVVVAWRWPKLRDTALAWGVVLSAVHVGYRITSGIHAGEPRINTTLAEFGMKP